MSLKNDIIRFAKELEEVNNASFDLWTWLPSRKMAEKAHGDYADEYQPELPNLLKETTMVLSLLSNKQFEKLEEESYRSWFGCPCEECAVPTRDELSEALSPYISGWGPTA